MPDFTVLQDGLQNYRGLYLCDNRTLTSDLGTVVGTSGISGVPPNGLRAYADIPIGGGGYCSLRFIGETFSIARNIFKQSVAYVDAVGYEFDMVAKQLDLLSYYETNAIKWENLPGHFVPWPCVKVQIDVLGSAKEYLEEGEFHNLNTPTYTYVMSKLLLYEAPCWLVSNSLNLTWYGYIDPMWGGPGPEPDLIMTCIYSSPVFMSYIQRPQSVYTSYWEHLYPNPAIRPAEPEDPCGGFDRLGPVVNNVALLDVTTTAESSYTEATDADKTTGVDYGGTAPYTNVLWEQEAKLLSSYAGTPLDWSSEVDTWYPLVVLHGSQQWKRYDDLQPPDLQGSSFYDYGWIAFPLLDIAGYLGPEQWILPYSSVFYYPTRWPHTGNTTPIAVLSIQLARSVSILSFTAAAISSLTTVSYITIRSNTTAPGSKISISSGDGTHTRLGYVGLTVVVGDGVYAAEAVAPNFSSAPPPLVTWTLYLTIVVDDTWTEVVAFPQYSDWSVSGIVANINAQVSHCTASYTPYAYYDGSGNLAVRVAKGTGSAGQVTAVLRGTACPKSVRLYRYHRYDIGTMAIASGVGTAAMDLVSPGPFVAGSVTPMTLTGGVSMVDTAYVGGWETITAFSFKNFTSGYLYTFTDFGVTLYDPEAAGTLTDKINAGAAKVTVMPFDGTSHQITLEADGLVTWQGDHTNINQGPVLCTLLNNVYYGVTATDLQVGQIIIENFSPAFSFYGTNLSFYRLYGKAVGFLNVAHRQNIAGTAYNVTAAPKYYQWNVGVASQSSELLNYTGYIRGSLNCLFFDDNCLSVPNQQVDFWISKRTGSADPFDASDPPVDLTGLGAYNDASFPLDVAHSGKEYMTLGSKLADYLFRVTARAVDNTDQVAGLRSTYWDDNVDVHSLDTGTEVEVTSTDWGNAWFNSYELASGSLNWFGVAPWVWAYPIHGTPGYVVRTGTGAGTVLSKVLTLRSYHVIQKILRAGVEVNYGGYISICEERENVVHIVYSLPSENVIYESLWDYNNGLYIQPVVATGRCPTTYLDVSGRQYVVYEDNGTIYIVGRDPAQNWVDCTPVMLVSGSLPFALRRRNELLLLYYDGNAVVATWGVGSGLSWQWSTPTTLWATLEQRATAALMRDGSVLAFYEDAAATMQGAYCRDTSVWVSVPIPAAVLGDCIAAVSHSQEPRVSLLSCDTVAGETSLYWNEIDWTGAALRSAGDSRVVTNVETIQYATALQLRNGDFLLSNFDATGHLQVWLTTDGGQTWTQVNTM